MTLLATAGPSALWYLTRATGAVTLVLLSVSVALGVANVGRLQAAGWPRFVVEGVHRNVSLLAIVVLLIHIATSVLDPFAGIHLIDAIVPFTGSYRPLWLGLGAFASDLLLAIVITSLVRRRLGHGVWRATHWLAYLSWPVAVLHTVGTGSDVKQVWLLALTAVCAATVIAAVWVRVGLGWPSRRGLRGTAVAASVALPAALVLWLPSGPLGADWARRAGTPASVLARAGGAATTSTSSGGAGGTTAGSGAVSSFTASVTGSVSQHQTAAGLVEVDISLAVSNSALSALSVRIVGRSQGGGGVRMTSSAVTLGSGADPQRFTGAITALEGTNIAARVSGSGGQSLSLALALQITQAGSASGTLQVASQ